MTGLVKRGVVFVLRFKEGVGQLEGLRGKSRARAYIVGPLRSL